MENIITKTKDLLLKVEVTKNSFFYFLDHNYINYIIVNFGWGC